MSKRLQVLVPDTEMTGIRKAARRSQLTVGEWVRRTLREARMSQPSITAERSSLIVRALRRPADAAVRVLDKSHQVQDLRCAERFHLPQRVFTR